MNFFHYKKWFFDVFTREGNYIILFVSVIKVGWKNYAWLQIHSAKNRNSKGYSNDITHEISLHFKKEYKRAIIFDVGWIEIKENAIEVQFHTTALSCHIVYASDEKSERKSLLLKTSRRSALQWKPLMLQGTLSGNLQVKGQGEYQFSEESGYCDLVESTIFPLKVPVRELYWGRIQSAECCVSWSVIKGKGEHINAKMFLLFNGNHFEFNEPELVIQHEKQGIKQPVVFPEDYILKGKNEHLTVEITLTSHDEILGNDFMDYAKEYGKTAEKLLRYFSRNPRGIKFRALATVEIFRPGQPTTQLKNLMVIDEYVRFKS